MFLETLSKGYRVELSNCSVVLIDLKADEMRQYPSILDAYTAEVFIRVVKAMEKAFCP
jgi:hypothetical protein